MIFCFFEDVAFSECYVQFPLPFCIMETTFYVFFPDGIFQPCDHGPGLYIRLMREFNQSITLFVTMDGFVAIS